MEIEKAIRIVELYDKLNNYSILFHALGNGSGEHDDVICAEINHKKVRFDRTTLVKFLKIIDEERRTFRKEIEDM